MAKWRATIQLAWAAIQVFGSRMIGQAAGLLVTVLATRGLAPAEFGLYAYALVVALLLAQVPGAGLDMAAVRVSAADRLVDPMRARGVLLAAFGLKLVMVSLVAVLMIGLTLLPWWGQAGLTHLVVPVQFAAVAAVLLALTEFGVAALQAAERFDLIFASSTLVSFLKLGPVVVLLWSGMVSLSSMLWAFVAAALAGWLVTMVLVWRSWFGPWQLERGALLRLLRYAGWMVAATLLGVVTSNLDVLLIGKMLSPEVTGVYSSGRSLALPLGLLGVALGTVLLPRFSRMPPHEVGLYLRQLLPRLAGVLVLAGSGLVLLAPWLVQLVFPPQFAAATGVVQLLGIAALIQVMTWPALAVLMVLNRPQLITWVSVVMLGFVVLGYVVVLPRFGMLGVAWIYLLGCGWCLPVYLWLARRVLFQVEQAQQRVDLPVTQPAVEPGRV